MVRIGGGVFPEIKEGDYIGEGSYRIDSKMTKVRSFLLLVKQLGRLAEGVIGVAAPHVTMQRQCKLQAASSVLRPPWPGALPHVNLRRSQKHCTGG